MSVQVCSSHHVSVQVCSSHHVSVQVCSSHHVSVQVCSSHHVSVQVCSSQYVCLCRTCVSVSVFKCIVGVSVSMCERAVAQGPLGLTKPVRLHGAPGG